jgi:replicative DNA helicase
VYDLDPPLAARLPPHNPAAERAVLSAALAGPAVADEVFEAVAEADFYLDAHRKLYAAFRRLHDAGRPIDLACLFEELKAAGHLADIGGATYLGDLHGLDPTGASLYHHAAIVREHAVRRAVIHAAAAAIRDAQDGAVPAEELVADLERGLLATAARGRLAAGPVPMAEAVRGSIDRIDARFVGRDRGGRVMTGLAGLDAVLGGLRPGSLTVVAARPSVGKTSLALGVLANAAAAGVPGLLFSLEMTALDVADRVLAMTADVSLGEIVGHAHLRPESVRRLLAAAAAKPDILIDATPGQTAAAIASVTRRLVRRAGVGVVVIDYLGLVARDRGGRAGERHDLELGAMVTAFKRAGQECGIPVVLLAQLNRDVERRADGRPTLADLKDSGEIEAHADAVILLKPEPFHPGADVQTVTALVAKNRQGPRADVPLDYRRPFVRFETAPVDRH